MYKSQKKILYKLVLVRHSESEYNLENQLPVWHDIEMSAHDIREAKQVGQKLKRKNYSFDIAFTSLLTRAIKTLNFILDETDLLWIPVEKSWRLNERMYGALQSLNKTETASKHREEIVKIWRISYDEPPPALEQIDPQYLGLDARYALLDENVIPLTECLKQTIQIFLPFWFDKVVPAIKSGKRVLVTAHVNSIRALVKFLDKISDDEIVNLDIPIGIPLVYELDAEMRPNKHYFLANEETVSVAML